MPCCLDHDFMISVSMVSDRGKCQSKAGGVLQDCTAEVPSAATFRRVIAKLRAQDYSADIEKDVTVLIRALGGHVVI